MDWREATGQIEERLALAGLDLVHPFPSRLIAEVAGGTPRPGRLGLVLGNSRALWPPLRAAIAADSALRRSSDPVDRYCAEHIEAALGATGRSWQVRWAHTPPPDAFPIQALARAAGLCDVAPCRLAVHPVLGTWFALRAVALVDLPGPTAAPAPPDLCAPCSAPCREPFEAAVSSGDPPERDWRRWLAVRDACPIGRAYRYRLPQIQYHYTKARPLLLGEERGPTPET